MEYTLSNSLVGGSKSLNPFGLSLDLQFAADKSLTARKGPTPTFTRASNATYHSPLIYIEPLGQNLETTGVLNGRALWYVASGTDTTTLYYNTNRWQVDTFIGGLSGSYYAAVGSEFRPDSANWTNYPDIIVKNSVAYGNAIAATNEPRFDYDPDTLLCKGLLIEESRTNLLFPSATLTTQTRTVTATPHTLSFYGTGTVALSGVTGPTTVTGTGDYPTRTTLTFTPTAGSLVLTVTGSVTQAQLEAGAFPTSYIPTTSGSAVRSADVCSITGSGFTSIYNESEHSLFVEASTRSHANFGSYGGFDAGSAEQSAVAGFPSPNSANTYIVDGSVIQQVSINVTLNQNNKIATGAKLNSFQVAVNNVLGTEDTSGTMPTATTFKIGRSWNDATISGTYVQFKVFKKRLTNAKLQSLTQ